MPKRIKTRSAGWATATPRGRRTGEWIGKGGGRTRGRSGGLGNSGIDGQGDQGCNQGDDRNQNGNVIIDNIQGNARNVIDNNDRRGCTYKEFLACNPKEYDGVNRPNQDLAINGGQGHGNNGNHTRRRAFMLGAEKSRQDSNTTTGIEPSDLGFNYEIEIASGQLVEIDK
nr:hypothetical protein [Tanacetum cinerariifolium]GEZ97158.1 hypothetical protein [Tanacetum cinerariifolium]